MKKILLSSIALFSVFIMKSQDITGTWNGTLSVQGHNLRIVFHISKDGDTYKATMDSPDQGANGLPVSSVTFEDNKIKMEISIPQAPPAEYAGELKENTITGNFRQMGFSFPLNLTRSAQSGSTSGFIRGRLFDSQTRESLPFSTVALLRDADSSLVTGVATDEDGRFVLENLRDGHYRLRVTTIGYHPYISHTIELRRGNNRLDLGSFFLNPSSTELMGVEIIATRPVLEQQAGKLVFNVAESTTSVGDNALETLKKFPGVTVDNDDNISLNGNSSVLVMIDGRPTHLSGAQLANLLKSLPSSDIDRIEAIDNPPARYEAEGIGGILNIRTKRTRMMGYSGTVHAGARYHEKFNHDQGFDLNFRTNKFTVFASLNISNSNSPSGMTGFTNFPDGSRWEMNKGKNEDWTTNQNNRFISGRAGFDYYINPRNILSLSYRLQDGQSKVSGYTNTRQFTPDDIIQSSFRQGFKMKNEWGNQNLNLNYQNIFDSANNRQFFIDASWVRNMHSGGGNSEVLYYLGDFAIPLPDLNDPYELNVRLPSNIFSIKADLEYPLNKETKIETGARHSYVNNDNNQRYYNEGVLNPTMSDHFVYTENITAFYGMINHKFSERTSVEAGLRGEYTAWKGNNKSIKEVVDGNYFGLFPSLNANQKLTQKTGLNFSYSYRLTRPHYANLNPLITRNLAYEFNEGNPNLNPEYSHIVRLAYTFNHVPIVRLSYARTDGDIRRITRFDGDTVRNRPENLGTNDAFGFNLMFQRTFFDKWRLLITGGGEWSRSHFKYDTVVGDPLTSISETRDFFRASYYISNDITLSKTMSMDINSWGMFPQKRLFTKHAGMYSVNIGLRKSFFDRKLTATLSLNDIFNAANKWTNDTELPTGQRDYREYIWPSRSVSVRLSYRFGKGNVQTRRMRDAANEEAGRMGSGDGGQGGGMGQ
ncbi:MAG: TonB-dependent receptor [Bacteroidales bacterium]|jgi:outer membrane receptor protein involved in Fe transport|nr:TonB-dependent receptor [Bacteroidales bacterium]